MGSFDEWPELAVGTRSLPRVEWPLALHPMYQGDGSVSITAQILEKADCLTAPKRRRFLARNSVSARHWPRAAEMNKGLCELRNAKTGNGEAFFDRLAARIRRSTIAHAPV
jgi:hypothetical protein